MSPIRADQSSSEYSSPYSQENTNPSGGYITLSRAYPPPTHPHNVVPYHSSVQRASVNAAATAAPSNSDLEEEELEGNNWAMFSEDESSSARLETLRPPHSDDDDDDDDADADDDDVDDAAVFPTTGHERRGKKGLSHAEMAMSAQRPKVAASPSEETEDEDDDASHAQQGERLDEYQGDNDDADETEDDDPEYGQGRRKLSGRPRIERRRSLWAQHSPIVSEVSHMLETRGVEPAQLGYASLASAGKGAVDYLVRKQSVVIGRMESLVDCCIKSEGRSVSRRHARLFWNAHRKEWVIECICERNCVVVNGIPLVLGSPPIPVKSRDLIELGDVAFFFLAATSPVFLIKDILKLEKTIHTIRAQEERAGAEEDRRRNAARLFGTVRNERLAYTPKRSKHKGGVLDRKRRADDMSQDQQMNFGKGRKSSRFAKQKAKLDPNSSHVHGLEEDAQDTGKRSKEYPTSRNVRKERNIREEDAGEMDEGGETEDERDEHDQEESRGRIQEESTGDIGSDSPLRDPFISNYNIRSKQNGGELDEEDMDNGDSAKLKEDWNKKERSDFCRALFAVGVDPIFAEDGSTERYDWTRFRKIAELPKKSDLMLEDYYIRMMGDVRSLLEEEEREKRTKGPRTKHKPGCDCVVCENTRKSRRKKRQQREGSNYEGASDLEEDVDVKSTAKTSDKLVGLVTAQKLRVRLSIHEAARNVKSAAGESACQKLEQQKDSSVRDLPHWWRSGYHDRALMRGTAIHGVGQWNDIWNDPRLKPFRKMKERYGNSIEWPSNQAAMKRVREISNAINAELRREAKRAAKEERAVGSTRNAEHNVYEKAKGAATSNNVVEGKDRKFSRVRKAGKRSSRESGDEYEAVHEGLVDNGNADEAEITDESGSIQTPKEKDASQIETEDEDDVEVEVEEMEIEEEEEDQGQSENDDGVDGTRGHVAAKQPAVPVADISTDEEEDEDNIQYETASDSGTE